MFSKSSESSHVASARAEDGTVDARAHALPGKPPWHRFAAALALFASVAVVLAMLGAPPADAVVPNAVDEEVAETTSADPLPTAQIDGIVWAQAATADTVFAGGSFSNARPAGSSPGQNQTPRSNLLAYDLRSGNLISSWGPVVNGRVLTLELSPDGSRLYVGGAFTSIDGQSRYRLAALDAATGEVIASWKPAANTVVQDIVATNSTVYVVGEFSNINGVPRTGVAALSAQTGEVLDFDVTLAGGHGVRAAVLSPDQSKLVIAGSFTSTNGSTNPGRGMAALDTSSGQLMPWDVNGVIRNAGNNAAIYSLASDGDSVYGTGYDFYGGDEDGFEGSFRADWDTGEMVWMEDCHGDSYSVHPFQGAVYVATHAHYCGNIGEFPQLNPWFVNHSLAFDKNSSGRTITPDIHGYRSFTGNPAARLLHWYPIWVTGTASGVGQAAWDIESSGDYLLYAGEFKAVSGVQQQGLVRFAKPGVVQPKLGPAIKGGAYKIGVRSVTAGQVRVAWDANYDPDDAELTYEVFRRGEPEPLYTTTSSSTYWVRDKMTFVDRNLTAGQSYDYRVRVTDPSGNWTHSDWTPVTVSSDGSTTTYNESVLGSEPTHYWPLGEPSGRTAFDWVGGNDLALTENATRGVSGHVQVDGETSSATAFSGSTSYGASSTAEPGADVLSVEAWFRTTSTSGGKIVGFGNTATGNSSSYDRHLYLDGAGRITFGVYPGQTRTLSSAPGFNDGEWHHVVGTLGPDGMNLYVDGQRMGQDPGTVSGQSYNGYWRIGGDQLSGWPNAGSSSYLAGQIADVAVYDKVLSLGQIDAHWVASGRTSSITGLPVAEFASTVNGMEVAFDASSSSDGDGPLTAYRWSFGDGATGEGETARHTYDAPGTYEVTLVVTDSDGLTASISATVTIEAQNTAPTAAFSTEVSGLAVTVDGSGSSDAEGSVASYAWDFGDGSQGEGVTASHEYSEAGTYEVSLTVTDSEGASDTVSQSVTVEAPPEPVDEVVIAEDGFDRSESNGWGSAEEGGDWSVTGGSAAFSVEDGVGKVALAPSHSRDVKLADVDALSTTTEVTFSSSEGMSGGASSLSVFARTAGDHSYSGRVRFEPDGRLRLYLIRDQAGLDSVLLPGEYEPGEKLTLKLSVQGTSPTTLALKVWRAEEAEPAAWQLETTDSTPALQTSGSSNMRIALSSTSEVSTEFRFYHFLITTDGAEEGTENSDPVAAFSTEVSGLAVTVDGSGSSDAEGSVASYAWDFGDGSQGEGVTASHEYSEAGTYEVSLTVTDSEGASDTVSQSVTVEAPPEPVDEVVIAEDGFDRSESNGWGSAEEGGDWSVTGGSAAFSVEDGVGKVALAPSHSRDVKLADVDALSTTTEVTFSSSEGMSGGASSLSVFARTAGDHSYSGRVRFEPDGRLRLYLIRDQAGLDSVLLPGEYEPGEKLTLKLSVQGTSPTTLALKVWRAEEAEPAAWQLETTDSTPALQTSGSSNMRIALSSTSEVSTEFRFYHFLITAEEEAATA